MQIDQIPSNINVFISFAAFVYLMLIDWRVSIIGWMFSNLKAVNEVMSTLDLVFMYFDCSCQYLYMYCILTRALVLETLFPQKYRFETFFTINI